jgi:hypothetical protein
MPLPLAGSLVRERQFQCFRGISLACLLQGDNDSLKAEKPQASARRLIRKQQWRPHDYCIDQDGIDLG